MREMTLDEFKATLSAQQVPSEHFAFRCCLCGTIQSAADLIAAGAGANFDAIEGFLAFSCVGRWTNAGPHRRTAAPGRGCDWTLGGLFKLHNIEVVLPDGSRHPRFEPATPEEAQAHMHSKTVSDGEDVHLCAADVGAPAGATPA